MADPRFTSIARTSIGIALRCELCKIEIEEMKVTNQGISLFELVRASLRHVCDTGKPVELSAEEIETINEIVKDLESTDETAGQDSN